MTPFLWSVRRILCKVYGIRYNAATRETRISCREVKDWATRQGERDVGEDVHNMRHARVHLVAGLRGTHARHARLPAFLADAYPSSLAKLRFQAFSFAYRLMCRRDFRLCNLLTSFTSRFAVSAVFQSPCRARIACSVPWPSVLGCIPDASSFAVIQCSPKISRRNPLRSLRM